MIDDEFTAAAERWRGALRAHCYRMLGSASASDDLVQETFLRAWKARTSLVDPARIKPWLFRIATNACLDEIVKRPRRVLASDFAPAAPGRVYPPAARDEEIPWLEPIPDAWLADRDHDAGARYSLRESVALAFVAALQLLTPAQRAVLLLRDVIGMSAEETAESLNQSVSATNSTLHRARTAIEHAGDPESFAGHVSDEVVARYVRAIGEHDLDAMLALLHEDMQTTMPPSPTWIAGRDENIAFYTNMFASWASGDARVVPIGVNGRTGFEFHRGGALRAIDVIETRGDQLYRLHHFMQPRVLAVFAT